MCLHLLAGCGRLGRWPAPSCRMRCGKRSCRQFCPSTRMPSAQRHRQHGCCCAAALGAKLPTVMEHYWLRLKRLLSIGLAALFAHCYSLSGLPSLPANIRVIRICIEHALHDGPCHGRCDTCLRLSFPQSLSSNLHTNWAWDWRARMWPSEPAMAHWAVNRVEKEAHEAVAR